MSRALFLFLIIAWSLLLAPQFTQAFEEGVNISVTIEEEAAPPENGNGGGGGGWIPPTAYATAVFKGKAYPEAFVTILKDGRVAATFKVDATGYFSKSLTGLTAGIYTFGIWAEDRQGRKSLTLSYTISLIAGATTTMTLFLTPTFELDKNQVEHGKDLGMAGQTFPLSNLNILVFSNGLSRKTSADEEGDWSYKLDTTPLALGLHASKTQSQTDEGEQSPFSETKVFRVVEKGKLICPGGDLNQDGKVNIIDFSIMLYWWNRSDPCADQNGDGIVNLIDFSILLYYWTG